MSDTYLYLLNQSRSLLACKLGAHLVVLIATVSYIIEAWLVVGMGLLVMLSMIHEITSYRALAAQQPVTLELQPNSAKIELVKGEQREQFEQFKVFSNRWFIILHLINANRPKHLMLVSDSFKSLAEYLSFRYQINSMSRSSNAA